VPEAVTASAATGVAVLGLGSLLAWTVIGTGVHWPPKLTAILLTPGVAFMVWKESRPITGWPTSATPPAHAVFVSGSVDEPTAKSPGAIYLWLAKPGEAKPRAYQLPYSRPLHKQVQSALQQARQGKRVGVRKVRSSAAKNGGGADGPRSPYEAYRLPPPSPGPKNTE
jgi:hypothetical protein